MKTNTQFKNEALAALRGNWGRAVITTLLYVLIIGAIAAPTSYQAYQLQSFQQEQLGYMGGTGSLRQALSLMQDPTWIAAQNRLQGTSSASFLVQVLLLFPLGLGFANAFRGLLVTGNNHLFGATLHYAFSNYWHKVWGMLLVYIFTVLWMLLFIIPGIIKVFSYSMTPYILEEYPELSASEAIHRSRLMMRGHKFDLFWLMLSFLGWAILCVFTAGIGFLWLQPYMSTSIAAFYEEVKAEYLLKGGLY